MTLHASVVGLGPRMVLLHGFTQNADCWGPFGRHLSPGRQLVLVDAPGHGRSGHDEAGLPAAAALVGELGGHADYLGYSMGGRIALHLALARPELVRRLVLIGATAGIDGDDERRRRRQADEALAQSLQSQPLEAFLERWLAGPLFAGLPPSGSCLPQRLSNRPDGLAASLRRCGTGNQEPLWDRLGALTMPVLVVAGQRDERFRALGERLVSCIGDNAHLAEVPGAGHAAHLERPLDTARVVLDFLGS